MTTPAPGYSSKARRSACLPCLAGAILLIATSFALAAEDETELVSLPELSDGNYPINMAGMMAKTRIQQLVHPGQSTLDPEDLKSILDPDRTSGVSLPEKGVYDFHLAFHTIHRLQRVVITGSLQGAKASVRLAELPLQPGDSGWRWIVRDTPLETPATGFNFRPQAAYHAIITISTASATSGEPMLTDIAFYSNRDVREFKLVAGSPSPRAENEKGMLDLPVMDGLDDPTHSSETNGKGKARSEYQHNLGGMSAGTRVAFVSAQVDSRSANALNDDDAATNLQLDSRARESMAILDLGENRRIQKISLIHSTHPGDLKIYTMGRLPWVNHKQTPNQVAWLDGGQPFWSPADPIASDIPLLAQLTLPPPKPTLQHVRIRPSMFDQLPQFGFARTDEENFTQLVGPPSKQRLVIIRFTNRSLNGSDGLRLHDLAVFSDGKPGDFRLIARLFEPSVEEPLIPVPPMAQVLTPVFDYSRVGLLQPPPSVSPFSP